MRYLFWLVSLITFTYVLIRSFTVTITCDEVWTLKGFVETPVWDIITSKSPAANNHILNTLLTKICALVSTAEFALRLPNVLAFTLYLYSCYKISGILSNNPYLQLAFYIMLLGNYTLLHLFGLCRGYGLSIGLMSFAIYQTMKLSRQVTQRSIHLCLAATVLFVYASFTTLFAAFALLIIVSAIQYRHLMHLQPPVRTWQSIKFPLVYGLMILALAGYPLYRMISAHELYYGGDTGFIQDTLRTLMIDYFGHTGAYNNEEVINTIFIIIVLLAIITVTRYFIKDPRRYITYIIPCFILVVCVVFINLQFYLLHGKLVISRTALYLYPLFLLTIFSAIALVNKYRKPLIAIMYCMAGLSVFSVLSEANFRSVREWWDDAYTKDAIKYIAASTPNPYTHKETIYGFFSTENSLNYYIERVCPDLLVPATVYRYDDTVDKNGFNYLFLKKGDAVPVDFSVVHAWHDSTILLYHKK